MMNKVFVVLAALLAVCSEAESKLPEEDMTTIQMIAYWGYPVESHFVTTEDGYILNLHRIPYRKGGTAPPKDKPLPVMFLQHGLLDSSATWVMNLPQESLGFMLADAGFDVWLGNNRGNTYSRKHVTLKTDEHAFWEFDYDEMALLDLPAMFNYVRNVTGQKKFQYTGHSEGTMVGFAAFSSAPEDYMNMISHFYALAPVARVEHMKGLCAVMGNNYDLLHYVFSIIGDNEFLPSGPMTKFLAKYVCGTFSKDPLCDNVLFLICGPNTDQLNNTRMAVYLSHTPAGTSTQNMFHFGQGVHMDTFNMYDYQSKAKNEAHYHQDTPPVYNVPAMRVNVSLYYSENDWLADPEDVTWLQSQLKTITKNVPVTDFNHMDFVWGMRAAKEMYVQLIQDAIAVNKKMPH